MSKYDWSAIPSEFNYAATNDDGFAFAFTDKPVSGWLHSGFWYMGGLPKLIHFPSENPFKGEWRESLEQRPNGEEQ